MICIHVSLGIVKFRKYVRIHTEEITMITVKFLNPILLLDSKKKDINPQIFIPEALDSLLLKRKVVSRKILQDYFVIESFRRHEFTMQISYFRLSRSK